MAYTVKTKLKPTVVALYSCPEDGVFECEVDRDPNGDAPEYIACPLFEAGGDEVRCGRECIWTPSADIACKVRRIEVTRGKYERPERRTYLDTRKLGEGQSPEEFRAERRKIWRDVRMDKARKEFLNK